MIFLGIRINTVLMNVSNPAEKLELAKQKPAKWQQRSHASKKQLQSLLGCLCHLATSVRPGRRFVSYIIDALKSQSFPVRLDKEFQLDIHWWIQFVDGYNGVSLIQSGAWSPLFSARSSLEGCGGYFKGKYFHTVYPARITQQHLSSTKLDLLAIVVACKLSGHLLPREQVSLLSANEAVCSVISSGRTRQPFSQGALRDLWFLETRHDFSLRCTHIASQDHTEADLLSCWSSTTSGLFFDLAAGISLEEFRVKNALFDFAFHG